MKYYGFYHDSPANTFNLNVFQVMTIGYGILIMEELYFENKNVFIELHEFMIKSISNPCFVCFDH